MQAIKNRRHGPDTLTRMITLFSFISWLAIILLGYFYIMSDPQRFSNIMDRGSLIDKDMMRVGGIILLLVNIVVCVWGLGMNMMRNKRKMDRFHFSLIVSLILSLAGFVSFLLFPK